MPRVLLATDADWIHEEVDAAIGGDDIDLVRVNQGREVRPAVQSGGFDLVVLDLQIGNMGGMAACMELRLDESVDLIEHVPVLMLLDREADFFLAKRSEANGWVVKPLDPFSLRRAATALLAGGEWKPEPGPRPLDDVGLIHGDDGEAAVADADSTDAGGDTEGADEEATAEVTASADEGADPESTPGTEESSERAADVQGP